MKSSGPDRKQKIRTILIQPSVGHSDNVVQHGGTVCVRMVCSVVEAQI